jgi:hypothetical protein
VDLKEIQVLRVLAVAAEREELQVDRDHKETLDHKVFRVQAVLQERAE